MRHIGPFSQSLGQSKPLLHSSRDLEACNEKSLAGLTHSLLEGLLKLFKPFSGHYPTKKEQQPRLPVTLFVIWAVCGLWLPLNIHLQGSGMYRKKNRVFRFKSFTSPLTFMFCFFLDPLSFFSFLFFFFCIFLPCFYFFSVEKFLRTTNAFRIIGLERGRYKSRTGSTRTASPGRINSDRIKKQK